MAFASEALSAVPSVMFLALKMHVFESSGKTYNPEWKNITKEGKYRNNSPSAWQVR